MDTTIIDEFMIWDEMHKVEIDKTKGSVTFLEIRSRAWHTSEYLFIVCELYEGMSSPKVCSKVVRKENKHISRQVIQHVDEIVSKIRSEWT